MNWINGLGILSLAFLVCFICWFVLHPISRDRVLLKFGRVYFLLVGLIMLSCTCLIAWLISKEGLPTTDPDNPFQIALQYCLKMTEAKDKIADKPLNLWAFIGIMLFQIVVFEGLVLAAIVGWTGRRTQQVQSGEVRYRKSSLNGYFVSLWDNCLTKCKNEYAVVIGANEVAPSVIKNLLKREVEKQSLNYAHERENQYVILQTNCDVDNVRKVLQSYLTEEEYNRVIIYKDLRNSYEGLKSLKLGDASEIYVLGENTTLDGGESYHDTMNMRCVNMIAKVLGNRKGDLKACKVLFEYQTTYSVFQFSDVTEEMKQAIHFIPFNRYDSWARRVMVDNHALALIDENDKELHDKQELKKHKIQYTPLDGYEGIKFEDDKRVHFIVVGMSKMGVAMGVQALFQAHYPNYVRDNSLKSRITFIDANAQQEMQFFKGRYASLFELARHRYIDATKCEDYEQLNSQEECSASTASKGYKWIDPMQDEACKWKHLNKNLAKEELDNKNFLDVEIEFVKGELESEGVREYLRRVAADSRSKVTMAICLPLTHQSIAAALYMPIEVYNHLQEIWVYQREAADIISNLTNSVDNNIRYKNLKPFGMLYGEYIDHRTHYLKALLVNGVYDMGKNYNSHTRDMKEKDTYTDLRKSWNDLSVSKKWSNMYFVDSIYQKMRSVMKDLPPEAAIGGSENPYLFEMENFYTKFEDAIKDNEKREYSNKKHEKNLARCEHNRWNVQQLLMGYMPCGETDLEEFAKLDKDKKMNEAIKERDAWRERVKWNTLEPLEQKRARESEDYYKLVHGQYDKKKNELKQGIYYIHPNICRFEDLAIYDSGAYDYDETLNNGMPMIVAHVDAYKMKMWEDMINGLNKK